MGSPRPSFGRAKNYNSLGRFEYGRLGGPWVGVNYHNSYINPNPIFNEWVMRRGEPMPPVLPLKVRLNSRKRDPV